MSDALLTHFNHNGMLSDSQFAYRPGKSTTSATLKLVDLVIHHLEDKKKVAGIFLDLSKAFDSVNHELLLEKLMVYGVVGKSQQLIKSFLQDREQTVEIKTDGKRIRSKSRNLNIGVPQGSSLGNTLFLAFVNDIAAIDIIGDIIQYADDTTIVVSADTNELLKERIVIVVEELGKWFKINGLKLNEEKTNIIFFNAFSSKLEPEPVNFNSGRILTSSNIVKSLGFYMDPALKWKQHIDETCKKMATGIYALKQLRTMTSNTNLKEVYYAYIHSILSYGIIIWGNSTDFERILKMQKRAVRVLMHAKYKESCREHFKSLKILTSVSVYILEIIKYVRKNISDYKLRGNNSERSVRIKMQLETDTHRLNLSKRRPKIIGTKLYNKLPLKIKLITSDSSFFHHVKRLLLEKTLYSVKEYMNNDYSQFDSDIQKYEQKR